MFDTFILKIFYQAKGDNQQSHIRKRDFTNGKSEKKDEKDKGKDNVETNDKKDIDGKKDAEEKGNLSTCFMIDCSLNPLLIIFIFF